MSAQNALLFIDANIYIDLYRLDSATLLLAPLIEQAPNIFVTQQVVDEVHRNKLSVVASYLRTKEKGMKLVSLNVPDQFSRGTSGESEEIHSQMKEIGKSVQRTNKRIDEYTTGIMSQVSESKDEVSKALASIFERAIKETPDELDRARMRKEVGNPPGKPNDALGDQITWEQIRSHIGGKKELWIISRDGDFGTTLGNHSYINALLRLEINQIVDDANIYFFTSLVDGLKHFVTTTGVEAEEQLSSSEVLEIELEELSLAPHDGYPLSLAEQLKATRSFSEQLRTSPTLTEQVKAAQSLSEQLRASPTLTEQVKAAQSLSEQLRASPTLTEQVKAAQSLSEQLRASPTLTEQFKAVQSLSEQLRTSPMMSEQIKAARSPSQQKNDIQPKDRDDKDDHLGISASSEDDGP